MLSMIRLCFACVFSLMLFPFPAAAEEKPATATPRQVVDYLPLAFQPETWKKSGADARMEVWPGREVGFLVQPGSYDAERLALWVQRLDSGWALYRDLTGAQPKSFKVWQKLPVIAAVPGPSFTCGAGCGYIGSTGIELALFHSHDYPRLLAQPKAMPHYVFYEMGRNFYTFGERHSCFITGFAVFMRYVCMDALRCTDEDQETRRAIEHQETFFHGSGLSFLELFTNSAASGEKAHRIHDASGKLIHPSDQPCTYASAMLRLRRDCGGNDWVRRFFAALARSPEVPKTAEDGPLRQCRQWFLAASIAAQRDLSPLFVDQWRLPMSDNTRKKLRGVNWTQPPPITDLLSLFAE